MAALTAAMVLAAGWQAGIGASAVSAQAGLVPAGTSPAKSVPAGTVRIAAADAEEAAWIGAAAAAAERSGGLDTYRTAVQQRSADMAEALALSRAQLLLPPKGASLTEDLAALMRLPEASNGLLSAQWDLQAALAAGRKTAALLTAEHAAAMERAEIYGELERQLKEAHDAASVQARFGLVSRDELARLAGKAAQAREDAAAVRLALNDARSRLEEAYPGSGLAGYGAAELFSDLAVDSLSPDELIQDALESDPLLAKLASARALEERKLGVTLDLLRRHFGAGALRWVEAALAMRPVDFELLLAVHQAFIAEVKRADAFLPADLAKAPYLADRPQALPAALLAAASAAVQERERIKSLQDSIKLFHTAAIAAEKTMRQALREEQAAAAAVQQAVVKQKSGLVKADDVVAAREAHAKSRLAAVQAKLDYFSAVAELDLATGGRLKGGAVAPIAAPAGSVPANAGVGGPSSAGGDSSSGGVPEVAYDPALEVSLAASAQKLQDQLAANLFDAADSGAEDPGAASGSDAEPADGPGEGEPGGNSGTESPGQTPGAGQPGQSSGTEGSDQDSGSEVPGPNAQPGGSAESPGSETPGGSAGTGGPDGDAGAGEPGETAGAGDPDGGAGAEGPGGTEEPDGTGGAEPNPEPGVDEDGGADGAPEETRTADEKTALLLTELEELSAAAALAAAAGAEEIAAAMAEKSAAAAAAAAEALGLSAPPGAPGHSAPPASEEERAARIADLAALLPYLELGLFPSLEAELLAGWAADSASVYSGEELAKLAAAPPWKAPDGSTAVPLPPDAVAFADMPVKLDVPPVLLSGQVYVPIRSYAAALGYRVAWDGTNRTVTLSGEPAAGDGAGTAGRAGADIVIRIGSERVETAGTGEVALSGAALLNGGQAYVPLDFFPKIAGLDYYWSQEEQRGVVFGMMRHAATGAKRSETFP